MLTRRFLARERGAAAKRAFKPTKVSYVFRDQYETVNIFPIEDEAKAKIVEEIVKKYEQRSDGI